VKLKKTGSFIAIGLGYFISITAFVSFHYLPSFSQQESFARLNLFTRTRAVQTTLSLEKKYFNTNLSAGFSPKNTRSTFNSEKTKAIATDPCNQGAQGGEVTNANGNANVSPDSKVNAPANAVDGDLSTYSELHIAVQQKDVEVVQTITFSTTTNSTDAVKLTLSLGETLMNYKITAQAYYNNTPVGLLKDITTTLEPILYPSTIDYSFTPGVIFNQVRIGVTARQNGNQIARIYLHEVSLTLTSPPPPSGGSGGGGSGSSGTISSITQCQGNVVLSVASPLSDIVYKWYDSSITYLAGGSTYSPPNLANGSYTYYVSASRCTIESAKDRINLTVAPKPSTPSITSN
jgi:hypothetical protein